MHTDIRRLHTVLDSPLGPLTLVAEDGELCGLYMTAQRHRPADSTFGTADPEPFAETAEQLRQYFAGTRTGFTVPLRPHGTPFQRTVWAALRDIPHGRTISYRELAARVGR
ncbi:methylated-DNA--[protein]-cysteine S-methyltransferase, partial [Streptomyces sparsus]